MKRVFGILMLTLLATASVSAQNSIYKAVVGAHKNAAGNIVVSDPSTTLAVDLTIETEQVVVGPYAKYAQKYLETRGTLVDKKTTAVTSAKIAIVADDALMADKIAEPETVVTSYMGSEVEFPKISPDRTSSSAMSLDDAAAEAAQAIYRIRKNRMELISGEAGENVFGAGLKAALEEIARMEREYLDMFYGSKSVSEQLYTFNVTITPDKNEYMVCRFSDKVGIVPTDDLSGRPIVVKVETAKHKEYAELKPLGPKDKVSADYLIVPQSKCSLIGEATLLDTLDFASPLYGKSVVALPIK